MPDCRTCGVYVRWTYTPNDGRIPVVEDDGGDLVLVDEGDRVVCYRFRADDPEHAGEQRYSSHLNECDGGFASGGRRK